MRILKLCIVGLCSLTCIQLKHYFLKGIKDFSVPIGLDDKVQVDLVIVGSVAVSEKGKTLHLRMNLVSCMFIS